MRIKSKYNQITYDKKHDVFWLTREDEKGQTFARAASPAAIEKLLRRARVGSEIYEEWMLRERFITRDIYQQPLIDPEHSQDWQDKIDDDSF